MSLESKKSETLTERVDFRDVNWLQNVKAGDLLVSRTPPGLGLPGKKITGAVMLPRAGKDARLPTGRGVVASEDGLQLFAAIEGHVVMSGKRIDVFPTYEVMGDVDFSVGHIDFQGNVVIHGNVHNDFRIQTSGHVQVDGWVDNAQVTAGGNIVVKGGIQGQRAILKANGNITAKYVENSQLEAGWSVSVQEAIMHARVVAGQNIIVGGRKGLIVGGIIRAGAEISAKVIGSPLATQTEIEVGVDPSVRAELLAICEQQRELTSNLGKSEKTLTYLDQLQRQVKGLPTDKTILLSQLGILVKRLRADLNRVGERRTELEDIIDQVQQGKVTVQDLVHPGVRVTIGGDSYPVRDVQSHCVFVKDGANILVSPFR